MLRGLRFLGTELNVWYHAAYRLPLSGLETTTPMDPRRADFVAWYLGSLRGIRRWTPVPISYAKIARVHSDAYLQSLQEPVTLGRIFGVDPSDVPVPDVLHTLRLACGGTLAAARASLKTKGATLNLLGGFHHAGPDRGGGFCAVNDVAIALTDLRRHGFAGTAVVLDLDAHPPDGTAACLRRDTNAWIGSISGSDWGRLRGVDETVLPARSGDRVYLEALRGLLTRMPRPDFAFVVAGGDVEARDALGMLGLTEAGVRERDRLVLEALTDVPSVWLPGGGYQAGAWRLLAGTALVLSGRPKRRIPGDANPMRGYFKTVAGDLRAEALGAGLTLSAQDVDESLGYRREEKPRFLGYYTSEGLEYALQRYGFLDQLRRFGYREFRIEIEHTETGDRAVLSAEAEGVRYRLLDCVAKRGELGAHRVLFIQWLSLSNPKARFTKQRPQLPGQEAPGLGLAREMGELLALVAERLELTGVALRPAWFHVAYAARHDFRFTDPARQGRFEALVRDLAQVPLAEATQAVADGRVLMDGTPYAWEATDMVHWLKAAPEEDAGAVSQERERVHFQLAR